MRAFADALDNIPLALAENAGLSPIQVVADIKSSQLAENNPRLGVDCNGRGTYGTYQPPISLSFPDDLVELLEGEKTVIYFLMFVCVCRHEETERY